MRHQTPSLSIQRSSSASLQSFGQDTLDQEKKLGSCRGVCTIVYSATLCTARRAMHCHSALSAVAVRSVDRLSVDNIIQPMNCSTPPAGSVAAQKLTCMPPAKQDRLRKDQQQLCVHTVAIQHRHTNSITQTYSSCPTSPDSSAETAAPNYTTVAEQQAPLH